jgi:CRP-like cAMP-binding protein
MRCQNAHVGAASATRTATPPPRAAINTGVRNARPNTDRDCAASASGGARRLIRRLAIAYPLSLDEELALHNACAPETRVAPQTDLIVEGEELTHGYVVEDGWACLYRVLNDGRRQILNFILPGDLVGTIASSTLLADHSVSTLTACSVRAFRTAKFADIARRLPGLQEVFDWAVRRELAIVQERIVDIGRRTARERMAHLLLELMYRLRAVGLCEEQAFDLPLTQEMLGDALGLSIVHVNRTLRRLNREELICYRPGHLDIIDCERLARVAEFDAEYLHQAVA